MRVSLKQTVLLTTALIALKLPTIAMEPAVNEGELSQQSRLPEYSFARALGLPPVTKGSEAEAIFTQTLALLTDEESTKAENVSEETALTALDPTITNLEDLDEQFKTYKAKKITLPQTKSVIIDRPEKQENITTLSLAWRKESTNIFDSLVSALSCPELNAPYQALFDDLYALTEPNSAQIALTRISNANQAFGAIITKRRQAVGEFVKRNGTTEATSEAIKSSKTELLKLKIKEQNRFKRALFDFILTREIFFNLNRHKNTYQSIIDANVATKSLVPTITEPQQRAEQSAHANIPFIQQTFLSVEAFIKATYPFSRSFIPTTTNKIAIGRLTATKQKRLAITGIDTLPDHTLMALDFAHVPDTDIDSNIIESNKDFMEILLSDSYALQEAILEERITFLTEKEKLAKLTAAASAEQKTDNEEGKDSK